MYQKPQISEKIFGGKLNFEIDETLEKLLISVSVRVCGGGLRLKEVGEKEIRLDSASTVRDGVWNYDNTLDRNCNI